MSNNYEKIKRYYDNGLWNIKMVRNVVNKRNGITKEEYKLIIGIDY